MITITGWYLNADYIKWPVDFIKFDVLVSIPIRRNPRLCVTNDVMGISVAISICFGMIYRRTFKRWRHHKTYNCFRLSHRPSLSYYLPNIWSEHGNTLDLEHLVGVVEVVVVDGVVGVVRVWVKNSLYIFFGWFVTRSRTTKIVLTVN